MTIPPATPPGFSNSNGRDNTGVEHHAGEAEQRSQATRQQGEEPPCQGRGTAQLGGRAAPQSQQHGQNSDFGPPPPPPRRYNIWGMDYRPYDLRGPFAEQSETVVPQVPRDGQSSDFGPPPPPPRRYNVRGMDYRQYDQGGPVAQQSRQPRLLPDLSGSPPPPPKPYDVPGMDYSPYQQGGGASGQASGDGQGSGGGQSSGRGESR